MKIGILIVSLFVFEDGFELLLALELLLLNLCISFGV